MAAGWITQINNFSDSDFTVSTDDGTWRPIINGKQYAPNENILVPKRRTVDQVFQPIPWWPPITVPAGPTTLDAQYMMIGWIDWARTRITGPAGFVIATIGPMPPSGNDFLRFFDSQQNELGSVEIGPRGAGWIASVDFHLNIYNPTPDPGQPPQAAGIKFLWWSQHGVGADILQRIDQHIGKIADAAASELGKQLIQKLFNIF
jgi:hypothetical protein